VDLFIRSEEADMPLQKALLWIFIPTFLPLGKKILPKLCLNFDEEKMG